jgi:hypothetical protein
MKSEKESQESIKDIGSFMIQLHVERNQQFKENENLKLHFHALETEKNLHFARKQSRLEMASRPFAAFTARPSRIRFVGNREDENK